MTIQGAITELDLLIKDNDIPFYFKPSLEKIRETVIIEFAFPKREKGEWVGIDDEPHEDYECDVCGYICSTFSANIRPEEEYKFCPNCGADMRKENI